MSDFPESPLGKFALILCFTVAACSPVFAQSEKPPLKWGMDSTGGAPYVFDNDKKGFEVELANYLAQELGRESEPVNPDLAAGQSSSPARPANPKAAVGCVMKSVCCGGNLDSDGLSRWSSGLYRTG